MSRCVYCGNDGAENGQHADCASEIARRESTGDCVFCGKPQRPGEPMVGGQYHMDCTVYSNLPREVRNIVFQ